MSRTEFIDGLQCERCKSQAIVHDDHACGRIQGGCSEEECDGCKQYSSPSENVQRYRCLSCNNTWSILRKKPIKC